MKKAILGLTLLGLTTQVFAQNDREVLYEAKVKKEMVPEVVLEAVESDFPGFVVEEFTAVPVEYIESDVIISNTLDPNKDYNTYQVKLLNKGEAYVATYNKYGELMSTVENLKDVALPVNIRNAVAKAYPGWSPQKDHYKMTHYANGNKKERYKIILFKNAEKKIVYTDGDGNILEGHHKK